jgi:hypothetical protein
MDKFKKEAVRGIQSHNNRERESHSNPDIDYERSGHNYDLHEPAAGNYAEVIQNRIDDLLLVKAVRKDAVHMCGLIVSSDSVFFEKLSPEETRRFFEESKAFLTEFVGAENVISAMVHMDEKTPHMHFLHVPVTSDGRLNANKIYTRDSLKKLQTELPAYLQNRGFDLQRGVEQEPGAAKKHLDTREFKQQQNALDSLKKDMRVMTDKLKKGEQQESAVKERVQFYERQALEAEKVLQEQLHIPDASMFSFKPALEQARLIIEQQKRSLAGKEILKRQNERLQEELSEEKKKSARFEAAYTAEKKNGLDAVGKILAEHDKVRARLEDIEKFFRWDHEANKMYLNYVQEQRREAERKAAEQKRQAQEREQQERRRQEEKERREAELAREQEAQRERERAQYMEQRRGMRMGR